MRFASSLVISMALAAGCQHQTTTSLPANQNAPLDPLLHFEPITVAEQATSADWRDLAPNIQINLTTRHIRIAAEICLDPATAEPGRGVPLEALLVTPVSGKEHEAIAVTKARPSDVHAACLLLNLMPGKPGGWTFDKAAKRLTSHAPSGPAVRCSIILPGGTRPLSELVAVLDDQGRPTRSFRPAALKDDAAIPSWHFAGSFFGKFQGREVYDADYTGIIIGLCTFGGEVLAWPDVLDPESARQAAIWYGRRDAIPPFGTAVMIELSPAP